MTLSVPGVIFIAVCILVGVLFIRYVYKDTEENLRLKAEDAAREETLNSATSYERDIAHLEHVDLLKNFAALTQKKDLDTLAVSYIFCRAEDILCIYINELEFRDLSYEF